VSERAVDVRVEALRGGSWEALREQTAWPDAWSDDAEVLSYLESVSACRLEPGQVGDLRPPIDARSGRLFDPHRELRWRWSPEGGFTAWLTHEAAGGEPARVVLRRYYLMGRFGRSGDGPPGFTEGRYPAALSWPVSGEGPTRDDRAYIRVALYQSARPRWGSAGDAAAREALLDGPMWLAHRFMEVCAGRGWDAS